MRIAIILFITHKHILTLLFATISHTRKSKSGCKKEFSSIIIGRRRIKSSNDLSASSMATLTEGSGARLLIDFCKIDFK